MEFVWDLRRAATNLRKHGVSFDEAATAFDDRLGAYFPDSLHEDRATKHEKARYENERRSTIVRSVRLTESLWAELERAARAKHMNLHQAMRAALLGWIGKAG